MCNDYTNHGGFNFESGFFYCWRCGSHKLVNVVAAILNITKSNAIIEINKFQKEKSNISFENVKKKIEAPSNNKDRDLIMPSTTKLFDIHKNYLFSRRFRPSKLEKMYGLRATTFVGDYKFRIIAPIFLDGVKVSFQGRDITDKSPYRYKSCKKHNEIINHKNTLYALDLAIGKTVIIVEGVTDVWRLGPCSIATFGTSFTIEQVKLISKRFKKAIIIYDYDAGEKAYNLSLQLIVRGLSVKIVTLDNGDPADLSEYEVEKIREEFL
jgi:DNA primase